MITACVQSSVEPPRAGARTVSATIAQAVQGPPCRSELVAAGSRRSHLKCGAAPCKPIPLAGFRYLENIVEGNHNKHSQRRTSRARGWRRTDRLTPGLWKSRLTTDNSERILGAYVLAAECCPMALLCRTILCGLGIRRHHVMEH